MGVEWRTVRKYKSLTKEERDGLIFLSVCEGERKIVSASGKTEKEAAKWLARHINRIARETEHLLMDAQLLTAEEIDQAVQQDVDRTVPPSET